MHAIAHPILPTEHRVGTTAYWEYGEGARAVVLVHGLRGTHDGLALIAQAMSTLAPDYRVIVPDVPGFGASGPAPDGGSIRGYSAWLRDFYAALDLTDAPLVGHSFGTIVCAAAIADGLRPSSLVLINPIATSPFHGPAAIGAYGATAFYRLAAALPESVGRSLLANRLVVRGMSVVMAKTHDRTLRRWIHHQHDLYFSDFYDVASVLGAYMTSVQRHVDEYAAKIPMRTLIIAGQYDDITSVATQQALRPQFPDGELVVYRGVGHLIHYEMPKRAATDIVDFFEAFE